MRDKFRNRATAALLVLVPLLASDALVRRQVWEFRKRKGGYSFLMKRTVKRLGWGARDFMKSFEIVLPREYPFKVLRAYTVNSRGRKVNVPPGAIRSFPHLALFPYFSFLRKYRIDFPSVEIPSESHVEIKGYVPEVLDEKFLLLEPYPSLEKRWVLVGFRRMYFHARDFSPQQVQGPGMDQQGRVLRFVNLPPYPREPLQPKPPSLVISTREGWGDLEKEVREILASGGLKDKVKIRGLFSAIGFLKARVKPVELPIKWSLLYARGGAEVLRSGYGSPVELAMLLRDVLVQNGYEAFIYFSAPREAFSEAVPALSQFDGVGVYLPGPGLYISSRFSPLKLPVDRVLWVFSSTPHFQKTSPMKPGENGLWARLELKGGEVRGEMRGRGNFILYGDPFKTGGLYLKRLGLKVEVKEASLEGNTLRFSAILLSKDNMIRIRPDLGLLPEGPEGFGEGRATPVELPQPFTVDIELKVLKPVEAVYLPSPRKTIFKFGRFSLDLQRDEEGIALHFRLSLHRRRIPPTMAPDLARLIKLCRSPEITSLVLLPPRL